MARDSQEDGEGVEAPSRRPRGRIAKVRAIALASWNFLASTLTILGGTTVYLVANDYISVPNILVFDSSQRDQAEWVPPSTTAESPDIEAQVVDTLPATTTTESLVTTAASTTASPSTTSTTSAAQSIVHVDEHLSAMPARHWTEDESGVWCRPPPHIGNDAAGKYRFQFTYAKGNNSDEEYDAFAQWDIELAEALYGEYVVEAWIPSQSATATVRYNIYIDENDDAEYLDDELVSSPILQQESQGGWRELDTMEVNGDVRVVVRNSETEDDFRDEDEAHARVAVDLIRLRTAASDGTLNTEQSP